MWAILENISHALQKSLFSNALLPLLCVCEACHCCVWLLRVLLLRALSVSSPLSGCSGHDWKWSPSSLPFVWEWCHLFSVLSVFASCVLDRCSTLHMSLDVVSPFGLTPLSVCNDPSPHLEQCPKLFVFIPVYGCVWMHVCAPCLSSPWGGQQRVSDPLGLESQTVASCHVGAGVWIRVLWKSKKGS